MKVKMLREGVRGDGEISGQQFSGDKGWGQERGVTTGHFTRIMGWESLAAGAGLRGFTLQFCRGHRHWQYAIILKPTIFSLQRQKLNLHTAHDLPPTAIFKYFANSQKH